jgi:CubicO group peptidase (beta-lactamase class C family)
VRWIGAAAAFVAAAMLAVAPVTAVEYWPSATAWASATPTQAGLNSTKLAAALSYGSARGGSGVVVRGGRVVGKWGSQTTRYVLRSTTKSFGAVILGLALKDGLVDLDTTLVPRLAPEFATQEPLPQAKVWVPQLTVWHTATHSGGFVKPGGIQPMQAAPGAEWFYSDGGPNWLADLLTVTYQQDLRSVLRARVLAPMGIPNYRLVWRDNMYRAKSLRGFARREFGSGISTTVDVMARLALMMLRDGRWQNTRILPAGFPGSVGKSQNGLAGLPCRDPDPKKCPGANRRYGLLFWNNADGSIPDLPRDAYWAAGQGTSFFLMIPSLDMVAARAGQEWPSSSPSERVTAPFFSLLARAASG